MCLSVKEKSCKQTAKKDIVCYKFLEYRIPDNDVYRKYQGIFITPYQYKPIIIGSTYHSNLVRTQYKNVEIGLHSFKSKKDCADFAKYWVSENRNQLIVRCIIPKGSRYYVGTYQGRKSYASTAIQYVEVVETITVENKYSLIKK